MLRSIIEAVILALGGMAERIFKESRTATDADRNVPLLRRAGSRIAKWMHKGGAGSGKQSNQSGSEGPGQGVST